MNTFNQEQFAAAGKDAVADLSNLALATYAGFEKMANLQVATGKSLLNDSLESLQAVANAKSPQEALAAQAGLAQPLAEKAAAYSRSVYEIASQTNEEIGKVSKGKLADMQKAFGAALETMTQNAPAGSEAFVAAFKNAATAGQQMMDSAQAVTKQAMEQAQAHATDVVAKATKGSKA